MPLLLQEAIKREPDFLTDMSEEKIVFMQLFFVCQSVYKTVSKENVLLLLYLSYASFTVYIFELKFLYFL